MRTFASPFRREDGNTRSRIACDKAVLACISPSASRFGRAGERFRAHLASCGPKACLSEPKSECDTRAIFGSIPNRRTWAAHIAPFPRSRGGGIAPDMRVGDKKGAFIGDHQAHRGKIGRAGNKPDNVLDVAQGRIEAAVEAANHGVGVATFTAIAAITVELVRTRVRAALGVIPCRPAASR